MPVVSMIVVLNYSSRKDAKIAKFGKIIPRRSGERKSEGTIDSWVPATRALIIALSQRERK
jgi:hypothetical protein